MRILGYKVNSGEYKVMGLAPYGEPKYAQWILDHLIDLNTSFNMRGEPIVCAPEDAFRCFMGTDIDVLVAENCFLLKKDQDSRLWQEPREEFAPD
jgi:predicted NodU family carbamoyl transferase